MGTLNIFDKLTAKLISKLNPQRSSSQIVAAHEKKLSSAAASSSVVDGAENEVEVSGILGMFEPRC